MKSTCVSLSNAGITGMNKTAYSATGYLMSTTSSLIICRKWGFFQEHRTLLLIVQ
jgi:hypothetical protein